MLYIVPTPIGNLKDMTIRSIEVLRQVDQILAEDTRTSKKLMQHFEVDTPLRSFHAHNEHKAVGPIVEALKEGQTMALVSDAGTPGISDPGFLLSRACQEEGIKVVCLPGATAFVPALVASGLPCNRFHMEGFLPQKKGRQTRLKYLSELPNTFVLYESPYRVVKCLKELVEYCGPERQASVVREISKLYEEVSTATLSELLEDYGSRKAIKGEFVIVVSGKE
jgi:16S rRNA (cytidine1402-2'-O)-methyltransferase